MSIPLVPLSSFSNLAGASLAADLRRLMSDPAISALVLFSDTSGENIALLPVGLGQPYEKLETLAGREIEGLRPLCALRLRSDSVAPENQKAEELIRLEESLSVRERYITECEQKLAEMGQNLAEREAMLEQREQMLAVKEREFFRRSGDAARQSNSRIA